MGVGRRRVAPVLVALAVLAGAPTACDSSAAQPLAAGEGRVVHVSDGDTFIVDIAGTEETVRLIGIDTPETVKRDSPVECFGPEASDRLKSLLPEGTVVRLERDEVARDQYDRLLAYVYVGDLFVNLSMVADGYADAKTYGDNETLASTFAAAEADARADDLGLWGACGSADVPLTDVGGR